MHVFTHEGIAKSNLYITTFKTAPEFTTELKKRGIKHQDGARYAFDAMWAAAVTLNQSLYEDPQYRAGDITDASVKFMVYERLLNNTVFEGISVSKASIFHHPDIGIIETFCVIMQLGFRFPSQMKT